MNVCLVIPAWGRYSVTALCLKQKRHLADVLAPAGIQVDVVVVAEDANVDLALEHGFLAVDAPNVLGRKVNDGFQVAFDRGADWISFCGSDDWIHPDLLLALESEDRVVSGNEITVVDLTTPRLRELGERGRNGVSPWFIPRRSLERAGVRLVEDERTRGMEGAMSRALLHCDFVMHDPHPHTRVDFKSETNMTAYDTVARTLGKGDELHGADVWDSLASHYPRSLVDKAAALAPTPA